MSGQCLCSWCVEARQRRAEEAAELRGLAAYDQARSSGPDRAEAAGARALAMREARRRCGAGCP